MSTLHIRGFDLNHTLHELSHYLPAQAPLKDFIHHNTLHAFQHLPFEEAIRQAAEVLGYKTSLSLQEYRTLYQEGRISDEILNDQIRQHFPDSPVTEIREKMISDPFPDTELPAIGSVRNYWKKIYKLDLNSLVHPLLFKILNSYLDQGIAMWNFPVVAGGLLNSLREMEKISGVSLFRTRRARELFLQRETHIHQLLHLLIGDEQFYEHYLFDQQFAHQGWSGMVATIHSNPSTLLDRRDIKLEELILLELILEIDALESYLSGKWSPLATHLAGVEPNLFATKPRKEVSHYLEVWQLSFEWTYYDQVLAGIRQASSPNPPELPVTFQALFCIDDRECSIRRHIENLDPAAQTFGTPGFFGVEFFFKPINGKFVTKLCPAPVTPAYLVKEVGEGRRLDRDFHLHKGSHGLFRGWLITQTLGFWSALRLFINIFKPSGSAATASSFRHMDHRASLTVLNVDPEMKEDGLQIGFTIQEMITRVYNQLRSIGLVKDFAPIVYVVGHGSSSINNPHFAAYDCGACSGRAGSVNARVFSSMANNPLVRMGLAEKGLVIPETTRFVGGLHDTTRDEVMFFDTHLMSMEVREAHERHAKIFQDALDLNAKERSRRFISINTRRKANEIHKDILIRSVSLFEPRPELNHATNALCIVGRREMTRNLFLDRRSFLNSYDYRVDPEGDALLGILKAAAPVCGGINLEYYFSRVDNMKLGAGTKLPHNVMGLFGVANGLEGDLRPGLPSQMIEVHDPVRLLIIVEQFDEIILKTLNRSPETLQWFVNRWIHLAAINPETREVLLFRDNKFVPFSPITRELMVIKDLNKIIETTEENIPVQLIHQVS